MIKIKNGRIQSESILMSFFRKIKLDNIAWSLRWLHCPVGKDDLVLEVGSGGSPYARSNFLSDAFLETGHRGYANLIADRQTVLAFVESLPFKDDSFDFVIASHVLEHSTDPEKFLSEIQRVAKAGYIEVPDAFMERLTNYSAHRLEIFLEDDCLYIKKKPGQITDKELNKLFSKSKSIFPYWLSHFPFNFHVRYYWSKDTGGIKYKIINPEYVFDWDYKDDQKNIVKPNFKIIIKQTVLKILRKLLSQNKRNKKLNIFDQICCPSCRYSSLNSEGESVVCKNCGKSFPVINKKIIDFTLN